MKHVVFILAGFLVFLVTEGQSSTLNDTVFKTGIYRGFEEVKNNSPSVSFDYQINTKTVLLMPDIFNMESPTEFTSYKISIDKNKAKSIGKVYAFSDGKNLYINYQCPTLSPNALFMKTEYLGRYIYFEKLNYYARGGPNVIGASGSSKIVEYIIDMETGQLLSLDKGRIRDIIKDDIELSAQFENENKKDKKSKEYLVRYLQRHNLL